MFKRLLTILLCAVMLSQVVVYSADFYSDADSNSFNITTGLLDAVGIIELDGDTDMATTVTKGDFLKSAVRLFLGGGQDFSKLDYTKYVELLGVDIDEITVNADNKVTYSYAVKALLHGLGYDTLVKDDDYYTVAIQTNLVKNISYRESQFITLEQQIKLFDNALNIKVMRMVNTGEYVKSFENTGILLEEVLKLQKRTGVVTGSDKMRLLGGSPLRDGELMIGDVVYQSEADYSSFLGMNVEFYISLKTDDNVLVYLYENVRKNDVVTLESSKLISYKGNEYTYWNESGKKEKVELAKPYYVIYNGFTATDLKNSDMIPAYGSVKLIDNDNNGQYDIVDIKDYTIGKVSSSNEKDEVIYVTTASGNLSVKLGDYDTYEIKNHNASTTSFGNIAKGDIVLVGISRGKHYAYVGKVINVVNGMLDGYSVSNNVYEFTVDGTVYESVPGCLTDSINNGNTYKFYINDGYVVGVSTTSSSTEFEVGFLVNAALDNVFQDNLLMKIFTSGGTMLMTQTAARVRLDNESGKNAKDVLAKVSNSAGTFVPQLIRYKLDSSGKVNVVDTPYNYASGYRSIKPSSYETADSFKLMYSSSLDGEGNVVYSNMGAWSGRFALDTKYVIFQIPQFPATADDSDFLVSNSTYPSSFSSRDASLNVDAYTISGSYTYADYVVTRSGLTSSGRYEGVIKEIKTVLDKDGNMVEEIALQGPPGVHMRFLNYDFTGLIGTYWNDSAAPSHHYDVGDFVSCGWSNGKVNSLTMIYDIDTGFLATLPSDRKYGGYRYYRLYNLYELENGAAAFTLDELTPGMTTTPNLEIYKTGSFVIVKVSKVRGKVVVEQTTTAEMVDYMSSETDYSKVMVYSDAGYGWLMVIYDL